MKGVLSLFMMLLVVTGVWAQAASPTDVPEVTPEATLQPTDDEAAFLVALTLVPKGRTDDGAFVLGEPDAPITIIEFGDWACPHCQSYRHVIEPTLAEYLQNGEVKFEFRTLPTAGGMTTVFAAQVAECADDQVEGGFWHSYFILYEVALANDYTPETISRKIAQTLNLDEDDLLECAQTATQIYTDAQLATDEGVSGTPGIMIRVDDGAPEFIEMNGILFNRGGVPAEVLRAAIEGREIVVPTGQAI